MKYSMGLDIGTTSVGWAIINEDKHRIEDLGVRIFERPENPKNGESLALPRRTARSARRRLNRRRQRLNYLKEFFISNSLLTREQIVQLLDPNTKTVDPYTARANALNQKISNEDLFIALYHIAKRRGYKSNRKKVEENDKRNDSSKVLSAIKNNQSIFAEYQTIGSALALADKYNTVENAHKRNKRDSYENSFIREDFEKEFRAILNAQGWSSQDIEDLAHSPSKNWCGIFDQRPFMTRELIEKMCGKCPFEPSQPRAARNTYTFEIFRLAQDLSHLTYNDGNKLTKEQIEACIEKCKTTKKVTYKAIREVLGYKNVENFEFDYIRGKEEKTYDEKEKHPFCELKFYHAIHNAASPNDWGRISASIDLFDEIGYILTVNKGDADIEKALSKYSFESETIDNLMKLSFSKFGHLSLIALRKLTPYLLEGNTYDQSVELAYPGKFTEKLSGNSNKLPQLTEEQLEQITNPVVKRAIGQTRKIINALIGKYGAPYQIKIECTNELSKTFDERSKIKKLQDENAENNTKIIEKLEELGITNPTGGQIVKYKLREQQSGQCMYCGKTLSADIFIDDKAAEVDHIIPFSRCGNDGYNNKVLVCSKCNQEKKDATPYEKWHSNETRWQGIKDRANVEKIPYQKRSRILAEKLPKEEWNKRALNDTRYIMKFMQRYIKDNLKFSNESSGKQKVILPTGFITNYLRKMYKLGDKDRDLNNCHHAVDACIVASISQNLIKKISLWNKYKELGAKYTSQIEYFEEDGTPHIITKREYDELREDLLPWPNFDKEVRIRSGMTYESGKIEKLSDFRDKFRDFDTYDADFLAKIHPLFVSRMPKRNTSGQAHKETIRSPKKTDNNCRLTRKSIRDITQADLNNSIIRESDKALYDQLSKLISEKGKDAFAEPVYKNNKKFDKNGKPISPVSTIKVYSKESSGILINHGTQFVNNGDQICLNVFKDNNKYIFKPVYAHSLKELNGKDKLFSIFPNDYIRITLKNETIEGYYATYDINTNRAELVSHNSSDKKAKIRKGLGSTKSIELLPISILGDNYKYPEE